MTEEVVGFDVSTPVRRRRNPTVRYLYFLQKLDPPYPIKIGVADDLRSRLRQHQKDFDFEFLGAMQWRNWTPEDGLFDGLPVPPVFHGRGGTAEIAERRIHELFERERLDKNKRLYRKRHEWFRPSQRLKRFIQQHSVAASDLPKSQLYELVRSHDEKWCWFTLPSNLKL